MKKILLISALVLSTLSVAKSVKYDYDVTPLLGYNINEENLDLDNQVIYGLEVQFNRIFKTIKPEVSIMYAKEEYNPTQKEPDIFRVALNGVYEYQELGFIVPLAKAGLGYRTLDIDQDDTRDTLFIDAGVGARLPLTKRLSLKAEALYMCDYNDERYDSNIAFLFGLNIGFGGVTYTGDPSGEPVDGDEDGDGVLDSKDICPNSEIGIEVDESGCKIDGDDDSDGILNSVDECPDTEANLDVNEQGCFVDGDEDNDGVLDSKDICANTPPESIVDADGCTVDGDDDNDGILNSIDECPNTSDQVNSIDEVGCVKEFNMQINFKRKSFDVDEQSNENIKTFADYLNSNMIFTTKIVGYTDSMGLKADNQLLSENRAQTVKDALVENGVSTDRITVEGRGEANPIADNQTDEGRAQNRRIEAELSRMK